MESEQESYIAIKWRKALERRGWHNIRRGVPNRKLVEFHVLYNQRLYSGRCVVGSLDSADLNRPGTLTYLFANPHQFTQGVWRLASPGAETGWVIRHFIS